MKSYERPVVIATYAAKELRAEAAQVVASSGQNDWNQWNNHGPR
jgi:hypothetical protein